MRSAKYWIGLFVTWLLGHGSVYYEWAEQAGWVPRSDYWYWYTGNFMKALQVVLLSWLVLHLSRSIRNPETRVQVQLPFWLWFLYSCFDLIQMVGFNPERYDSFVSECVCGVIAVAWTFFFIRPRLRRLLEKENRKKINHWV